MSDFGDRPFVAGSLIGIRSFRAKAGWLCSPLHTSDPWPAGENVAECGPGPFSLRFLADAEHQVAGMNCSCGFYAYFDLDHNPYHSRSNILGLIEGYGVATVGSRGFRCEKARLVAIVLEPGVYPDDTVWANYPEVPSFRTVEAAVAEFPLTVPPDPPPGWTPAPRVLSQAILVNISVDINRVITAMTQVMTSLNTFGLQMGSSMAKLAEAVHRAGDGPTDPRERALWLRKHRNTGPVDPYRLTRRRTRDSTGG